MRAIAAAAAGIVALVLVPVLLITVVIGGAVTTSNTGGGLAGPEAGRADPAKVPPLAAQILPDLDALTAAACPQLPVLWLVALAHTESSWNPAAYNPTGRAAGLVQMTEPSWTAAGGTPWTATPPPADADVLQPATHLRLAVPWICTNLRTVTAHLTETGKPTPPLDALLVCHIAGCGRVLDSRTGIPAAGEAGCSAECAATVARYITTVHENAARFAAPAGPALASRALVGPALAGAVSIAGLARPAPFTGTAGGCVADDPTRAGGCLTAATAHALHQIQTVFGPPGPNTPIRSISCWDEHAWNPDSDHPDGRACDLFPTQPGRFPAGEELAHGWRLATWLRTYAAQLNVGYLIWQGRFWSSTTPDEPGNWGRTYTGGGIYDVQDPTGGHYDHIHLSLAHWHE